MRTLPPVAEQLVERVLEPTPGRLALPATVVRVGAGIVYIAFGISKFIHHAKETAAFDRYGLPAPAVFASVIGVVELGLGVLLVLGLVTRLAALGLAGDMVGAIATGGRVDGGFLNLVVAPILLVGMLALVRAGPGCWAVDTRLREALPPRFRR